VASHDDKSLQRDQVAGFGSEIRELLGSKQHADQALAGIIVDELDELCECKTRGQNHPKEKALTGRLHGLKGLVLYRERESVRVYFEVIDGRVWMLGLLRKRRTDLTTGEEDRLLARRKEAHELAIKRGQEPGETQGKRTQRKDQ